MSGYNNPYVLLTFPELGDNVSVLMRNPQLVPTNELTPKDVPTDEKGNPLDSSAASEAMCEVFARIIVAWKVYAAPAFTPVEMDTDADPVALFESLAAPAEQERLGAINSDNVKRLPARIFKRIVEEIGRVADPQ